MPGIGVLLARSLFSGLMVRFDEHRVSRYARVVLERMKGTGWENRFLPAGLALNLKDEKGYALDYHRADDLSGAVELFCSETIPHEPLWFRNMTKSYLSAYLDPHVTFITMALKRISDTAGSANELYLEGDFANHILKRYYASKGLKMKQFVSCTAWLRMMAKPAYLSVRALLSGVLKKEIVGTAERGVPRNSVWIEYEPHHGVWVDFRQFLSTAKWDFDGDIVYYLDRQDTPVTKETTDSLEAMGFKWVDLHGLRQGSMSLRDMVGALSYCLGSAKLSDPAWLLFFRMNFMVTMKIYLDLFKAFNVKILIQHQEASWGQEAQAQAMKEAGGIMVGLHWSNYINYAYPSHLTPHHVFFAWGEAHYDLLEKKGNTIGRILPCGVWIKESPGASMPRLDLAPDIRFVISVFDDNGAYNLSQSPETLSEFYLSILRVMEGNKHLGAVIKSKAYRLDDISLLPAGDRIVERMKTLIGEKRMIVLDFRQHSPVIAAKRSDLSVCYGINSAGIIAGLHGCRVVCWDCTGWLRFPIYREEGQQVIFRTLEDLESAIGRSAGGDMAVGDFSRWRKIINYYDDVNGRERIRDFIDTFMVAVNNGRDRESSIEHAVAVYKAKNGVSDEFCRSGQWWNEA